MIDCVCSVLLTYKMINYSIIIPHKNTPDLLQRCLNSIPHRDDVQIIVVDDNSDADKVDFEHFPGIGDQRVDVYFTKEGKGAGYARNVGMSHAKGKWLIFADADDWYLDNIGDAMDMYLNSEYDMLVFRQKRVDIYGVAKEGKYDKMFDVALDTGNLDDVKYFYACPYARFIKREFVENNNIEFQQVRYSNDVMFSLKVSLFAKRIKIIDEPIYCVFESGNSLTRNNNNLKNYYVRTKVALDVCKYLNSIGDNFDYSPILLSCYHNLLLASKLVAFCLLPKIYRYVGMKRIKTFIGEILEKDYPKYYRILKR